MVRVLGVSTVVFFIAACLFFGLWRYEVLDHRQTLKRLTTASSAIAQHEQNIQISERTNHEYQTDIDRLNADIKRLRLQPAKCIPITKPTIVYPKRKPRREHAEQNGISSQWLYDYGREAEQLRIERNACKKFVNEVWEGR